MSHSCLSVSLSCLTLSACVFSLLSILAITMVVFPVVALDNTYNWPWENIGSGKYTLKRGIVCPCVLIIVLAKSVQTKRKLFPFEPKMEHLIVRGGGGGTMWSQAGRSSFKHTALTPALCHCRPNGSMFLRSMTRQLILSFKIWGGSPLGVRELRNSNG